MNEKLAKEIAEKITIKTVNRTFGYEYDEMLDAIYSGISDYNKATSLNAEELLEDFLTPEQRGRKEYKDQIEKNLEELGEKPAPMIKEGQKIEFKDKSVSLFEHEDYDSISLVFAIKDRTTARVSLSREAAWCTMELIRDSMTKYSKRNK